MTKARLAAALACALLGACSQCGSSKSEPPDAGTTATTSASLATPVTTSTVALGTLKEIVSGPGRTDAIEQQVVRAPFAGVVESLTVADGDHVRTHQTIGAILSENSAAALAGAEQMLRTARTPLERRDAERALALARSAAVAAPLRVPETGVVVSHMVSEGDRVAANANIVTIAALDAIVFVAQITQTELTPIAPGQAVEIDLATRSEPAPGRVHAILPSSSAKDLTAPVRVDFTGHHPPLDIGIFGTAHVVVGEHRDVPVVPDAAVLRNDVTGAQRVAIVSPDQTLHWETVQTGLRHDGRVEITSPSLAKGTPVVVQGQVGLSEGARVAPKP